MTENKRFKLDNFDSDIEMWELLNIQAEVISDLEDENEQLKQERQLLYENIDFFKKFIEKQGFKVKLDDKLFRVI